jgi:hypothetical protein
VVKWGVGEPKIEVEEKVPWGPIPNAARRSIGESQIFLHYNTH